jgi:hypothetical protein
LEAEESAGRRYERVVYDFLRRSKPNAEILMPENDFRSKDFKTPDFLLIEDTGEFYKVTAVEAKSGKNRFKGIYQINQKTTDNILEKYIERGKLSPIGPYFSEGMIATPLPVEACSNTGDRFGNYLYVPMS